MAEVISGVGKNARRTDMNTSSKLTQAIKDRIPSSYYGEQVQLNQLQSGADLQGPAYKVPDLPVTGKVSPQILNEPSFPITAPTNREDELPETGMNFSKDGMSPGPEVLIGLNTQSPRLSEQVAPSVQYDQTPETQEFYNFLVSRGL